MHKLPDWYNCSCSPEFEFEELRERRNEFWALDLGFHRLHFPSADVRVLRAHSPRRVCSHGENRARSHHEVQAHHRCSGVHAALFEGEEK
jgi:hypothetical protein